MLNHYDPNQPRRADGQWTDGGTAIQRAASDKKDAKTIKEAEDKAKTIFKDANYEGLDIKFVNKLNEAGEVIKMEFPNTIAQTSIKSAYITATGTTNYIGKNEFEIEINKKLFSDQDRIKTDFVNEITKINTSGLPHNIGTTQASILNHEFGHVVDFKIIDSMKQLRDKKVISNNEFDQYLIDKKSLFDRIRKSSDYTTNQSEMMAEGFSEIFETKYTPKTEMGKGVHDLVKKYQTKYKIKF